MDCRIATCVEIGRGFLGEEAFTYKYELRTCDHPLFSDEERQRATCRGCHKAGAVLGRVYEGDNTTEGWVMTELSEADVAERLARPAVVRSKKE